MTLEDQLDASLRQIKRALALVWVVAVAVSAIWALVKFGIAGWPNPALIAVVSGCLLGVLSFTSRRVAQHLDQAMILLLGGFVVKLLVLMGAVFLIRKLAILDPQIAFVSLFITVIGMTAAMVWVFAGANNRQPLP